MPWATRTAEDVIADYARAEHGFRAVLRLLGQDPESEFFKAVPGQALRALLDAATPAPGDPSGLYPIEHCHGAPQAPDGEIHLVGPVRFTSVCAEHLAAFTGYALVAYIPRASVTLTPAVNEGMVHHFARRPTTPPGIAWEIVRSLQAGLCPEVACAVVTRPCHACGPDITPGFEQITTCVGSKAEAWKALASALDVEIAGP
jgi:GTP cyclohydrolase I